MRITLNLATRPFVDLGPAIKRLRIAMGVLAGVCLLLLLGLHEVHQKAEKARAHEHSLDGAIAQVQKERQGYVAMMKKPDNAALVAQVEMLNQLFEQKSFSWTLAMENLETVLPAGVQVTQIQPVRAKGGQITLQLRVLGPHDLSVDLVRNLEHSRRFRNPRISGESAESGGSGPNQRLEPVSASNRFEFDLLADYNPPTPSEEADNRKSGRRSAAMEKDGKQDKDKPQAGARRTPHTTAPAAPGQKHHPYTDKQHGGAR
jgi:type IV pilus assembly protein PilN